MKKGFIILFSIMSLHLYSQEKAVMAYLLVRIETEYKSVPQYVYYTINAEGGCDEAAKFYSFKKFNPKKDAVNAGAAFYPEETDTSKTYYNYFKSTTLALNFILKNGWELLAVYSETSSGSNLVQNGNGSEMLPVTTVSSHPVFCFKKIK